MRVKEIVAALCLIAVPAFAAGPNLVVNGDFEQNGGPGTNVLNGWTIFDQSGGSGSWFAQKGDTPLPKTYRCVEESVAQPPSGFAAMTTQSLPGSHILYQDVALPAAASRITLSYDLFIFTAVAFASPPSLDYVVKPNTQFRADVVDPAATVNDVGAGVLANVYQSKPGDPVYAPYKTFAFDLTPFAGRTIRLRFAQVDSVDCFNAGLDNVSITVESCPVTAPAQLAIGYSCPTGCVAGTPVNFSATSPSYLFQACDGYAWDFGDGSNGASSNPTRIFANPGTYTVHLVVTNALGTTSAATSVTIAPVPPRQRTVRR